MQPPESLFRFYLRWVLSLATKDQREKFARLPTSTVVLVEVRDALKATDRWGPLHDDAKTFARMTEHLSRFMVDTPAGKLLKELRAALRTLPDGKDLHDLLAKAIDG